MVIFGSNEKSVAQRDHVDVGFSAAELNIADWTEVPHSCCTEMMGRGERDDCFAA